ncbi:uncharacterized protein LOC120092546 [Benincasa hispida]|uniref:uncharacterized protein LOC120092546 n=1 Tax=Benincasa hispida TaxID=102211 RepID=UPI001900002C|nr:uncharacterized protein LOC120092546 [Benincasa hispida]
MARLFPSISNPSHHHHHHLLPFSSTNFSFLISSIAVLSIFALVVFLCTSSRKSNKSQQRRNFVSKMNSNISSRAISMAKMISWRKVEAADEEDEEERRGSCNLSGDDEEEDEEEVWRKTIIRGERCRPLEFSDSVLHNMRLDYTIWLRAYAIDSFLYTIEENSM